MVLGWRTMTKTTILEGQQSKKMKTRIAETPSRTEYKDVNGDTQVIMHKIHCIVIMHDCIFCMYYSL